jgi:cellulose synthase/poly-beta-1,6-N-acetylglucosamine synthase-like glycosyltransferase
MAYLFWLSIFMIFYVYVGYPIAVVLLSLFVGRRVQKKEWKPFVSIIIAAFNESEHIQKTIQNKLDLDYPKDRMEILVVSDASNDGTDELVNEFKENNVRLIRQEPRAGKTSALNMAVPQAKGEIIVFSDANSIYDSKAIKKLLSNFSDPGVGYVTGKMIYVKEDGSMVGDGCSAYMKYENFLRTYETRLGSVVGVDGGIDAIRKELYDPMKNDQLPDFVLPLKVVEKGYRVVYEPEALLKEDTLKETKDEYKMRVRVSLRAMWALFYMRGLMRFRKGNSLFSWQLWSHKTLRYACFLFLFSAFISNIFLLSNGNIYILTFIFQLFIYLASILPVHINRSSMIGKVVNLCNYFILLNITSAHAALKFLLGKKKTLWNPRSG